MLAVFIFILSNRFILIIPHLKGGEEMRPRRYPYSGKRKKQSDEQIAKLKRDIDVNRTNISSLKFAIETLNNHQNYR